MAESDYARSRRWTLMRLTTDFDRWVEKQPYLTIEDREWHERLAELRAFLFPDTEVQEPEQEIPDNIGPIKVPRTTIARYATVQKDEVHDAIEKLFPPFGEDPVPYYLASTIHQRGRIKDPDEIARLVSEHYDADTVSKIADEIESMGLDTALDLKEIRQDVQHAMDHLMSIDGYSPRDQQIKHALAQAIDQTQLMSRRIAHLLEESGN